ncbi:MAG: hybrid sensor histidine kinase/response regulator [Campylobacterota bacterium]|nr:hybrid sensor histidine kinase/response regulator [Campylobacterota bacterium]
MLKTVLIVDNNESVIDYIEQEIKKEFQVVILKTSSFKEAIRYINNEKIIHVAIVDFDLAGAKNGQITNYTMRKSIPSIILSDTFSQKLKDKIFEKNILDYVIKDTMISMQNIVGMIRRILSNYDTKVLLVDDSPLDITYAKEKLENMKLDVTTASNGREAFELLVNEDHDFSLVLTDYIMPNMDGMQLTLVLRKIYKKDKLGIIALSSSDQPEVATAFIKIGANDFINKPYSDIEFSTRVNSNLELLDIFKESREKDKQLFRSEKLTSMAEMISNIAHQWRQPLSAITTASSGIQVQKEYNLLSDKELDKFCNTINHNAKYLSNTIDGFGDFLSGDRKKSLFNLTKIVDRFLELIEVSIEKYHINIVLDLNNEIDILGYENDLIQAFINIFNNIEDIYKEIETEPKYLFITTFIKDEKATIRFKDNAGGIKESIMPKIFEPYFTTKHQSQGKGLGLHMTYSLIVDGMDGTIDACNEEYYCNNDICNGTEITITLPLG